MATINIGRKLNSSTDSVRADQGTPGASPWPVADQTRLIPVPFDTVTGITYDSFGNVLTAVYKNAGVVVATLTMTYDGSGNLTSAVRS